MDWKKASRPYHNVVGDDPTIKGVYWVQVRRGLAHIEIEYTTRLWKGGDWKTEPGEDVYYWDYIGKAPEPAPEYVLYADFYGIADTVQRLEAGVELYKTPPVEREKVDK